MKQYLITFRSVTPAQKAQAALLRAGMHCSMRRTPRWMQEQGCGYSLGVRTADGAAVVRVLREYGLDFQKVYLQREPNRMEELEL